MVVANKCPECGATLPLRWPRALCSVCELDGALEFTSPESQQIGGAGTRFGDYELLEELARGGMGVVYRARQVSLNRIVAIKFILSGQFASQQEVIRFQSEAEAAANLRHPNIVAIYEAGEQSGQQFIAMEYVAGRTFGRIIREEGPMPAKLAAGYARRIAEAIQYAHERGTLHRDLQPSNVLIDADDQPRITDFGLAKRSFNSRLSKDDPQLTVTGQVLGSPGFIPPEQAMGSTGDPDDLWPEPPLRIPNLPTPQQRIAQDTPPAVRQSPIANRKSRIGPWSDVYGIGATLYYLLTGRPPFQGQTIPDVLRQLHEQDPVGARLLNPSVPQDLETICLKCLEKAPEKRYHSAQELADELGRFQRDEPIRARPVSRPEKVWRWCRRKPVLAGLVGGLHLVGVLGLAGIFWQWTRAEDQHSRSEQRLYVANVSAANVALENHDLASAGKFLTRVEESPQQRAMRAWEWRYLVGECHSDELVTLGRHEAWVEGVAASADGQWAASIDSDGVVKVWDLKSRKEFEQWRAHTHRAEHRPGEFGHTVVFSPDGRVLATGGADCWVRLWDPASHHHKLADLLRFKNPCTGLAFSQDGRLLAAISRGGEAALWALSNNPPTLLLSTNTPDIFVYSIGFAPDHRSLAIAGVSRPLELWDISDLPSFREQSRFEGATWPMTFSLDGESLFAPDRSEHVVCRWDVATGQERQHWPECEACFIAMTVSPDSRTLASTLTDGKIVIYDLKGEREPRTLMGHEDMVTGLAFSGGGQLLVSSSYDRTVRLWDPYRTRCEKVIQHGSFARGVCFSPDSRYVATVGLEQAGGGGSATRQSTLKVWDLKTLSELGSLPIPGDPLTRHTTFSPDGQFLAVDDPGVDDPGARTFGLFGVRPFRWVTNLAGICPSFSVDGRSLVYACTNRIVRLGLSNMGNDVESVIGELSSEIGTLALSQDQSMAVCTLGEDEHRTVEFWDMRRRRRLGRGAAVHENRVHALAFSPDGKLLASASWDGSLGIWDATRQRPIKMLDGQSGHSGELYAVCFSPDGLTIAACGTDAKIGLWNTKTLEKIGTLSTHAMGSDVQFSPDGHWLGAAVYDGTIHLWHAPALGEIAASLPRPKALR